MLTRPVLFIEHRVYSIITIFVDVYILTIYFQILNSKSSPICVSNWMVHEMVLFSFLPFHVDLIETVSKECKLPFNVRTKTLKSEWSKTLFVITSFSTNSGNAGKLLGNILEQNVKDTEVK